MIPNQFSPVDSVEVADRFQTMKSPRPHEPSPSRPVPPPSRSPGEVDSTDIVPAELVRSAESPLSPPVLRDSPLGHHPANGEVMPPLAATVGPRSPSETSTPPIVAARAELPVAEPAPMASVVDSDEVSSTGGSAVVRPDGVTGPSDTAEAPADSDSSDRSVALPRSWIFRTFDAITWFGSRLFGVISMVVILAAMASVPLAQFLCLGYLFEVTGRLGRGGKLSDAMIGIRKASRLGSMLLGTWLILIPIRFVSLLWYEAYLIDPASAQTRFMWGALIAAMVVGVVQIVAAWMCGGRLRYFFWQLVAPLSFALWLSRRVLNSSAVRPVLEHTIGRFAPRLVHDMCRVRPPTDWFVPSILWQRIRTGRFYVSARDGLWEFLVSLRLPYYFWLGLKGAVGTFLWLLVPTLFLIAGTATNDARAGLAAFAGTMTAVPVFALLPFLQVHFARDGRMRRFLEVGTVLRYWYRAPLAHLLALLVTLVFALPLFLLKIETIPAELMWLLSVVFVVFIWPSKLVIGLAYRRGSKAGRRGRWWWSLPVMALALPVSLAFIVILFFTRYITWHGAWSLFENHVFLLPAPFWL